MNIVCGKCGMHLLDVEACRHHTKYCKQDKTEQQIHFISAESAIKQELIIKDMEEPFSVFNSKFEPGTKPKVKLNIKATDSTFLTRILKAITKILRGQIPC